MSQQGHIRLYGAGGFGVNIVSHFESAAGIDHESGHSVPHPVYIDTSRSNLREGLNPDHVFILDSVDGSGKVRRENHEEIGKNVKAILQQHKPLDFNVVVFSASGGSGSVFGPLLISELLSRGLPVVGIVVGSDESTITAQNTLNTLKSLESIAQKTEMPVVVCYEHNERDIKRSVIDASCQAAIGALSVLNSKHNAELDSKDIANWVHFHRTTSVGPRLALFEVYRTNEDAEAATQPVAIASLYDNPDAVKLQITPEYQCEGYPREPVEHFTLAHFVITVDGVAVIAKKMQQRINELDQERKSRVKHTPLVSDTDAVTDDGMVL